MSMSREKSIIKLFYLIVAYHEFRDHLINSSKISDCSKIEWNMKREENEVSILNNEDKALWSVH